MASDLALQAIKDLPEGSVVLDPMSGSGTVMKVAVKSGHVARGFDIDPMAVLLSKVQTRHVDQDEMLNVAERLLIQAKKMSPEDAVLPWVDSDKETKGFIDFWYDTPQKNALRVLAHLISRKTDKIGDTLSVAMSRLIITKNKGASLAGDVSHSRPHRIRKKGENDFDVFPEFMKSCKWVAKLVNEIPEDTDSSIELGDARNMHQLGDGSIDALVSSPPYLNAIDYLRGHKMALVWAGYTIPELRTIRSGSVGASKRPDPDADQSLALKLTEYCEIEELPQKIKSMIIRYAIDINDFVREAARVIRQGGQVVYVVGNSRIKGTMVKNTEIIKSAAKRYGLELVSVSERDIPASSRYLPPPKEGGAAPLQKRMGVETVLAFTK
jgi:DNA modification methylase